MKELKIIEMKELIATKPTFNFLLLYFFNF